MRVFHLADETIQFALSLSWTLVEIFRENKINKDNKKSDVETYVEGLSLLLLTLIWISE